MSPTRESAQVSAEREAASAAALPRLLRRATEVGQALEHVAAERDPGARRAVTLQLGMEFPEVRVLGYLLEMAQENPGRLADFLVLHIQEDDHRRVVQRLLDRLQGDAELSAALRQVMPGSFPAPMGSALAPLKARLRTLSDRLIGLADGLRGLGYVEQARPVQTLIDDCRGFAFRVFVVGEWSSGKSTLLNALLGQEILPTGFEPMTPAPTRVGYGEWNRLLLKRRGEAEQEQDFELLRELTLSPGTAAGGEDGWQRDLEYLRVEVPAALLQSGIEFVDTPGLNDPGRQAAVVADLLPQADAVLLVLRASQPLTAIEQSLLLQAQTLPAPLRRWLDAGLVAFTFTDVVRQSRGGIERVKARAETLLRDLHPPGGFAVGRRYWLNAQGALLARLGEAEVKDPSVADFEQMERDLLAFLAAEYSGSVERHRTEQAQYQLEQAGRLLRGEVEAIAAARLLTDEEVAQLGRQIQDVATRGRAIASSLRDKGKRFTNERQDIFQKYAGDLIKRLPHHIQSLKYPGTVVFNPRKVGQFFVEQAERWIREEMKRWHEQQLAPMLEHFLSPFRQGIEELRADSKTLGQDLLLPDVLLGQGQVPAVMETLVGEGVTRTYLATTIGGVVGTGVGVAAALALALPLMVPAGLVVGVLSGLAALIAGDDALQQRTRDRVSDALVQQLPTQLPDLERRFVARLEDYFQKLAAEIDEHSDTLARALREQLDQKQRSAALAEQQRAERRWQIDAVLTRIEALQKGLADEPAASSAANPTAAAAPAPPAAQT